MPALAHQAGTLLKHQIPIRTFAEWDEPQPGFAEIDLVAHDGGLALGDFCRERWLMNVRVLYARGILNVFGYR